MKVEKNLNVMRDSMPSKFQINKLGKSTYELSLNENIEEITIEAEEGKPEIKYKSDLTMGLGKFADIDEIKGAFVRLKYSINKEYSLINKGIEDKNDVDYLEYRNYVDECKNFVNNTL